MKNLTPDELTTISAYNKHAKEWSNAHSDDDFYAKEYVELKRLLPKGRLLDIGCGSGRDAKLLTNMGYNYLGTDIAEKLIEVAKKNTPEASFLATDIYSMDFKKKFDGFWCAAVLLHIPRNRLLEALNAIAGQIKSDGIGFISTKQGTSDEMEPLSYDPDEARLQVHYNKDDFDAVLKAAGFEILQYTYRPLSERSKWMCYFVKKT